MELFKEDFNEEGTPRYTRVGTLDQSVVEDWAGQNAARAARDSAQQELAEERAKFAEFKVVLDANKALLAQTVFENEELKKRATELHDENERLKQHRDKFASEKDELRRQKDILERKYADLERRLQHSTIMADRERVYKMSMLLEQMSGVAVALLSPEDVTAVLETHVQALFMVKERLSNILGCDNREWDYLLRVLEEGWKKKQADAEELINVKARMSSILGCHAGTTWSHLLQVLADGWEKPTEDGYKYVSTQIDCLSGGSPIAATAKALHSLNERLGVLEERLK